MWWIGNFVLVGVVAPVVVLLLWRVSEGGLTVRRAVDDLTTVGSAIVRDLEPVPQLVATQEYVTHTTEGLARYGAALEEVL